jgi:hypothetical protein
MFLDCTFLSGNSSLSAKTSPYACLSAPEQSEFPVSSRPCHVCGVATGTEREQCFLMSWTRSTLRFKEMRYYNAGGMVALQTLLRHYPRIVIVLFIFLNLSLLALRSSSIVTCV